MGSINYTDPTEMFADIMRRFQIEGGFPKELLGRFYVMAIFAGIIVLGLFVAMAILGPKKTRVIGIIAGALNFISLLLIPNQLKTFHNNPFIVYIYGSSQSEVAQKMMDFYIEQIPTLFIGLMTSAFMVASFVLALVFIVMSFKQKPRILPIFALVLQILRYVLISPMQIFIPLVRGYATVAGQTFQLALYCCAIILPVMLVFAVTLINFIKGKKVNNAPIEMNPPPSDTEQI